MTKRFQISFHPEIFKILGEQLVSDPVIAIQELIKNAYDAESVTCDVIINTKKDQIIVEDKGHGMDEDAIKNGWLNVGTPLKRKTMKSKNGKRYLTGSMGVGRLSAFTLGNIVEIITTAEDGITRKFKLILNELLQLDNFNNYFVEIEELYESRNIGTKIIVSNLKIDMDDNFKHRLLRMLSILVVPNNRDIFKIIVDYNSEIIEVDPKVELAQYQIRVECKVDKLGIAYIDIFGDKNSYLGQKDLLHNTKILLNKYPELKDVHIELNWYMHGSRERLSFWKSASSNFSQDMRAGLSGIRIYRDGIRVLPYGEIEDDSFNIDKRYVSLGAKAKRPRNVQFIGWIFISRNKNPNLLDTSNREGLVNNFAYKQLYDLIDKIIDEFTDYRISVEETPKENKINVSDTQIVKQQIKSFKNQLDLLIKDEKELPKNITHEKIKNKLNNNIEKFSKYIDKIDDMLDVEALYRDRITAGNMINNILHYVGSATSSSKEYIELAIDQKCKIESHEIAFKSIMNLLPRIIAAYDILKGGSTGIGKRKQFNVYDKTKILVENLRIISSMKENQIKLICSNIDVDMRESDYWAIIANLLINAITCQDYEHAIGKKFAPKSKREIILTISKLSHDLIIQCEDNGPGLPDKPIGWIWQQFTSTRKPAGSGLGLFIISEIVTYYGGMKIASSSQKYSSGAHFYIQIKDVVV